MSEKQPQNEEKMPAQPAQQPPQAEALAGQAEQHEKELSPEVMEKIMEKVQDIDAKETAYSIIGAAHSLVVPLRVFKDGLLGSSGYINEAKRWVSQIKAGERQFVWFNIVGRSFGKQKIKESYWWAQNGIAVIFDLSPFHEEEPEKKFLEKGKLEMKSFWSASPYWRPNIYGENIWRKTFGDLKPGDPRILEHKKFNELQERGVIDESGRPMSDTENGFELQGRVAPRYFLGLVMGDSIRNQWPALLERLQKLYHKKEELLFPFYDNNGNLLWPQKMSYEEVKKFVAEQEEEKKEIEGKKQYETE